MQRIVTAALAMLLMTPNLSTAAEVQNTQFAQEGEKAVATYDLVPTAGEEETAVSR